MRTRVLILTIAVSLFASACVNGDETSTTTTSTTAISTTTTVSTTTTAASEPIELDANYPIPEGTVCFYLANFVAVPAEEAADAQEELNSGGISATLVGADAVLVATTLEEELPPAFDEQVMTALNTSVGFLNVEDDPLQVSLALRDILGIEASPINVVGFTGHIHFQPGTDPSPVPGFELPEPPNTQLDGQYVAVVDSGIVLPENPQSPNPNWFYGAEDGSNPFVIYDPVVDTEELSTDNPASHGTFVSGLIRQIAPSKQVTFAAARLVNTADPDVIAIQGGESLPEGLAPTSEIQVAEAMARLLVRHGPEVDDVEAMKALNLSLGTYVCDPMGDADMVTLKTMSSDWLETFPLSHIMAAAGNENYRLPAAVAPAEDYVPFWPAALSKPATRFDSRIHAVAAVDRTETEIVWVNKSPYAVADPPGRPWVTDWAPGADLVNLGGGVTSAGIPALVCWSGSSFATPVASAQFALNITPATKDYSSVDGLTFVEPIGAAASEVVTVGGSSTGAQECDHDAED